jgi:uncharacterized DUF497 family protein
METTLGFVVQSSVIEEDRPAHIDRHGVTIDEVLEALTGDYIVGQGKHDRYIVIAQTRQARFLAIVVGARDEPGTYGLITARPAHRSERRAYTKTFKGGDDND